MKKLSKRLGLEEGAGSDPSFINEFVGDRLPKNESLDDFKHKQYNLYELIESKKPSWKSENVKKLNYQQKKALFDIKKEKFKYADFDAINQLWHSYFDSVLAETKTNADHIKLSRADFHGALFRVIASKNTTVIGTKGYVLQESKHTFRILNQKNRLLSEYIYFLFVYFIKVIEFMFISI